MTSRAFLLALDAQLAGMGAQIATIRAQIAPWVELQEPVAVPSAAVTGSGSDQSPAVGGTLGSVGEDRIADATNSESGVRLPPTPVTRPPAKGAAPAGASLTSKLLEMLRDHAASGEKLPQDKEIARLLGSTPLTVRYTLKKLRPRHGITMEGRKRGRIVTFPGVERAAEVSTFNDGSKANPPPVSLAKVVLWMREENGANVVELPNGNLFVNGGKVTPAAFVDLVNEIRERRDLPPFILADGAA